MTLRAALKVSGPTYWETTLWAENADYEIVRFPDQLLNRPTPYYEASNDHAILSTVESGLGISITYSLITKTDRYRVV